MQRAWNQNHRQFNHKSPTMLMMKRLTLDERQLVKEYNDDKNVSQFGLAYRTKIKLTGYSFDTLDQNICHCKMV